MWPLPISGADPTAGRQISALPALMLLADGRFPAGGHAHSAGAEAACADARVTDEDSLAAFVEGRVRTTGLVDAALAAATRLGLERSASGSGLDGAAAHDAPDALGALDAEADARIAAPPLRAASRRLGRQLVRVAGRCWPEAILSRVVDVHPDGVHQPVALGAVGWAAGLDAHEVALLAVHHAVTTPAQAAVRLLGLDPFAVAALGAGLADTAAALADRAVAAAASAVGPGPVDDWDLGSLPALASPLVEIAAVEHATWDLRMFAT
jgi:urease accessory protein